MGDRSLLILMVALAEASLLLAPIAGGIGSVLLRRASSTSQRRWAVACAGSVAAAVFGGVLGWSFAGVVADAIVLSVIYLLYCLASGSLLRIRPRLLGLGLALLAYLPVLAGYFAATVGMLGVGLIVADEVPLYEERVAPTILCRVYTFGNATTSTGGYVLELLYQPAYFPFLETMRASSRIDDSRIPSDELRQETPPRLCKESGHWHDEFSQEAG